MQSSLARTVPRANADAIEMHRLARQSWHQKRKALIPVDELHDDWERQIVTNIANRLYGKATP